MLNTTSPVLSSIPSKISDGNVEEADISIGSAAETVSDVSIKKSGNPTVPGRHSMTFSPDKKC